MVWDKGFNLRATSGYVTDGAGETYLRGSSDGGGADDYPQTRNGVTFGCVFGGACQPVDRDNTVERRFAGINQAQAGIASTIRVDLEAADTYDIRWANGDTAVNYSGLQFRVQIFDDTTLLYSYVKAGGIAQDHYYDASGVDRTEAAWPGSNVAVQLTFATTTFKMVLGGVADSYTPITHLFISRVVVAPVYGFDPHRHTLVDYATVEALIDTPTENSSFTGSFDVAGWTFDNRVGITKVEVFIDGVSVGLATYGSSRSDVATEYPNAPEFIGYSLTLNTSSYSLGAHTILVKVTDMSSYIAVLPDRHVTFT